MPGQAINNYNNNNNAIETGGTWNHWAIELVHEIGIRATLITLSSC